MINFKLGLCTLLIVLSGCTIDSEVITGPFLIRDGVTFHQSTDTPVTGVIQDFHANGQLRDLYFYKNGIREGLFESFHPNGQLRERAFYADGVKNGQQEIFNDLGSLSAQVTYRSGIREGAYTSYDKDGKVELMGRYVKGKKNGPLEGFRSTGEKGLTGNYLDGYAQGEHSVYGLNGQVSASWLCDGGRIVDESLMYYPEVEASPALIESHRARACEEVLSLWWHSPFEELGIGL